MERGDARKMVVQNRFTLANGRFFVLLHLDENEQDLIVVDLKSSSTHFESGVGFNHKTGGPYLLQELKIPYPIADEGMVQILKDISRCAYKSPSGEAYQRMLNDRPEFGVRDPERDVNDDPVKLKEFQEKVLKELLEKWEEVKSEIPSLVEERKRCRNLYQIEREMVSKCPLKKGQKVLYKNREFVISDIQVVWGGDYSPSLRACIDQLNSDGWIARSCYVSPDDLVLC